MERILGDVRDVAEAHGSGVQSRRTTKEAEKNTNRTKELKMVNSSFFKYAIDLATKSLRSKWAILITHDEHDNIIACHTTDRENKDFVERLEAKLFEGIESYDITNEGEA